MKIKLIKFPGEATEYLTPTWDEMDELAFQVSKKILAAKKKFDRIVTLAKGGWPLTRSMVAFLSIDQVASIGVKFYQDINQRLEKPQIYQDIPEKVSGENVLLFDDVADTGKSLEFAKEYLINHGVAGVTTASLFYKPHSIVKPDYYGAQTSAWIIFPYDAVETINILGKKWQDQGLKPIEIKQRLQQLGINPAWIEFYLKGGE
ncbi:MAG: phosphoribosyltransferase family protein [Patescibacteria group bacterium]|nr:hypothetical protein [Patescibacteria group bacterium]MDZ4229497.1 phosphoribosyltransferase family protein [Patescibacteria group bacterium]